MGVSIETRYLTNNPCYKQGRKITVRGLMLHSIGTPQPDPLVFIKNWNSASYDSACVHGFVGQEKVYITLPCFEITGVAMRGWHAGAGANNTHIGIEMTEPSSIRYTGGSNFTCSDRAGAIAFVKKNTENAAELFAKLCIFHGLDPMKDGVIISHAEGYRRGIASNHGDPDHLWRGLGMGYNMDKFRADVAALMKKEGKEVRYNTYDEIPSWAKPTIKMLIEKGYLRGSGAPKDKNGYPTDLDLSFDMIRMFVINDRAGIYD